MVYKELLTLEDDHCARVARVVSILGANKQIYSEAKGLLYSLNTIKIKIDDLDRLWLRYPRPPFDISISRKQHYSDKDRTKGLAPPIQWLELPTYLGRCEKIKIVLSIKGTFWQHFTPAKLKTMLVHFNSLVYTKLMKHEYLHTIHMELELTEEYNAQLTSTVTDRQMLSFEQGCLNSLCRLRGMLMVHLKGFRFIDPFDVFLVKRTMLLPSSMWWSSFFAIPKMMQAVPQWWQLRNLSKHLHCVLPAFIANRYARHSLQPLRTLRRYYSQPRRRHFHSFSETAVAKSNTCQKIATSDPVVAVISCVNVSMAPNHADFSSPITTTSSGACSLNCEASHSGLSRSVSEVLRLCIDGPE